jgi:hypothetical protein|tara:strand:- start:765 stop:1010 length:246 start_codon:yes stop_codon:yes gene_type:complete
MTMRRNNESTLVYFIIICELVNVNGPTLDLKMEELLLHKIRILEGQLAITKAITKDTWLTRIWQDHINDLMLKVSRLNKTN